MTPSKFLKQYDALLEKHGSQRAVAKAVGIPRTTIQDWLTKRHEILFRERKPLPPVEHSIPKRETKRWIITSAQDESEVHLPFWRNLQAYAEHMDAHILVGGYTYNKSLYEAHSTTLGLFDPEISPYLTTRRHNIGDNLAFCGEMNTLPTAKRPLQGFEAYTRERWGIFPHAKVQLVSIPTAKGAPAKQLITTGSVTKRNYVQKRAGIEASFHHIIGAVIVELDSDGDHFVRHLIADEEDGSFQDLTRFVLDGVVHENQTVLTISHGDIHFERIDPSIARAVWGVEVRQDAVTRDPVAYADSLMAVLKPKHQFLHDLSDFTRRNHHNVKDPIWRFRQWHTGEECVGSSYLGITAFLREILPTALETHVVWSNHDAAAMRWIREADWRDDPVNAQFYLQAASAYLEAVANGENFSLLQWAVAKTDPEVGSYTTWWAEDASYTILDVEHVVHGHNGANGSAGSLIQFAKAGPKSTTGHTHSPAILDGAYCSGTYSLLDLGYNKGLSSWAHALTGLYPTGARVIITLTPSGKWCAQ